MSATPLFRRLKAIQETAKKFDLTILNKTHDELTETLAKLNQESKKIRREIQILKLNLKQVELEDKLNNLEIEIAKTRSKIAKKHPKLEAAQTKYEALKAIKDQLDAEHAKIAELQMIAAKKAEEKATKRIIATTVLTAAFQTGFKAAITKKLAIKTAHLSSETMPDAGDSAGEFPMTQLVSHASLPPSPGAFSFASSTTCKTTLPPHSPSKPLAPGHHWVYDPKTENYIQTMLPEAVEGFRNALDTAKQEYFDTAARLDHAQRTAYFQHYDIQTKDQALWKQYYRIIELEHQLHYLRHQQIVLYSSNPGYASFYARDITPATPFPCYVNFSGKQTDWTLVVNHEGFIQTAKIRETEHDSVEATPG